MSREGSLPSNDLIQAFGIPCLLIAWLAHLAGDRIIRFVPMLCVACGQYLLSSICIFDDTAGAVVFKRAFVRTDP